MPFRKYPSQGELPVLERKLDDDPEIDKGEYVTSSSRLAAYLKRHPKLQSGIIIGTTGLTLGIVAFLGGCSGGSKHDVSPAPPTETVATETTETVENQRNPTQNTVSEPIAIREPGEIPPREINRIGEDIGGLARVDYRGWIQPNQIDGRPGNYTYDFSNTHQTTLALVESIESMDQDLFDEIWYLPGSFNPHNIFNYIEIDSYILHEITRKNSPKQYDFLSSLYGESVKKEYEQMQSNRDVPNIEEMKFFEIEAEGRVVPEDIRRNTRIWDLDDPTKIKYAITLVMVKLEDGNYKIGYVGI